MLASISRTTQLDPADYSDKFKVPPSFVQEGFICPVDDRSNTVKFTVTVKVMVTTTTSSVSRFKAYYLFLLSRSHSTLYKATVTTPLHSTRLYTPFSFPLSFFLRATPAHLFSKPFFSKKWTCYYTSARTHAFPSGFSLWL